MIKSELVHWSGWDILGAKGKARFERSHPVPRALHAGHGFSDGEDRVCGFLRRRYDREEKAEFVADGVTIWFTRPHNGIAADLAQVQFVGWGGSAKIYRRALRPYA